MPIYEYRCGACGHEFETIQKVGARPLRECPECTGKLEKLISRTAFQLKGGGWFAHDYSGSSATPTASEKKTPKSSDGKAGTPPGTTTAPKSGSSAD